MAKKQQEEILVAERDFDSIYSYDAGAVRSRFLIELRDNQKITGTKCPKCKLVYVPARSSCNKCFGSLSDFVEVANTGTLTTFSVVSSPQPYYPAKPPFIYGVVLLDGADTGLVHLIGGVKPEAVKIGMRVQAVFNQERKGSILDIKYFKPVEGK